MVAPDDRTPEMSADCCSSQCTASVTPRFRRALWIALVVNAAMFAIELVAGLAAGSVALLADAVDFFGDAANYAISLIVLALLPVWRTRAALLKGLTMGGYGLFVLGQTGAHALSGTVPEPTTMGAVALLALVANVGVAILLYAFRDGDANMRSVWLCSRNDAIGNVAVMIAAAGVLGTGTAWPDLLVALVMAVLGLTAARTVIAHAIRELRTPVHAAAR
jgi:Co/Zn/Cd efflux system component